MLGRREELEREAGAVEQEEKELWGEASRLDKRKQDIIRQDKGTNTGGNEISFLKVRVNRITILLKQMRWSFRFDALIFQI